MILTNARVATMATGYGLISHGAIMVQEGRIVWVGAEADLPDASGPRHDMGGRLITPALIDCHSHVVFAGSRAAEFEMRLNGASYADVARAGGGIMATVTATRVASEDDLLAQALARVDQMLAQGVATLEIKSGYGLDVDTELRILRVARRIGHLRAVTVRTTFLGAHAVPPGLTADTYIDQQVLPALHAAHAEGLVDAVDGFCETIAFSPAQIERVFTAARALGLPVKLHAEQLSNLHGAALAARHSALSADHLEYLDEAGAAAMAEAGSVAVILPGAFYTLRETQLPPIDLLRSHGVPMAVATDCNPGTAPMTSLPLAMNMACTLFRLTPLEALQGTTLHAARALGLADRGHHYPRPARRSGGVGRRASRRTFLSHRRHPAVCPHGRRPS
ncbi:imidazolonepropionase [Rhodobacter ferrooxidans]|uniref:Imidazolonepropionase n=1 Tax=Rhodobacter ferrooxidans TaxID=371731 RepID=C8S0V0_9RHOB|nr:imidazolonepropionase [Rhodobacter sp. SW2]